MNNDLTAKMIEIRELMDSKGFSSNESRIWELLSLIHTEISESTQAYRKGQELSIVGEELMDAIVRILHLLSVLNQDPEKLYDKIMKKNRLRPPKWNTNRGG